MSVTASGRGQGQLYVYYASSCLPVLGRVVCYVKAIFLTECRVLRDPHGFLFGLSFLRISESLPSPKDFHVAFGHNGQTKGLSVKVIHARVSPSLSLVWHSRSSYHSSLQQRTCYGLDYNRIGVQFPTSVDSLLYFTVSRNSPDTRGHKCNAHQGFFARN
jgi:hypothetical protein